MRQLILMRHAKSSWADAGQRDLDRPLNKRGRSAAGVIGAWMKRQGYAPDRALVSSARRAQETWDRVVDKLGAAPTSYLPEIYHAGPETLLEVLHRAGEGRSVLMIGHQPGIGGFAARLLASPPADPAFAKYPTGATAVIGFEADWPEIDWGTGRLVDFVVPRALEG
jgi:phosphohistidine phosphatase